VAWGTTNGNDDAKDWYKLKITKQYDRYQLDGQWLPLKSVVEQIKIRGQKTFSDTVYYSVHGPVVSNKSFEGKQPALLDHA
jgi:penicillin amidase